VDEHAWERSKGSRLAASRRKFKKHRVGKVHASGSGPSSMHIDKADAGNAPAGNTQAGNTQAGRARNSPARKAHSSVKASGKKKVMVELPPEEIIPLQGAEQYAEEANLERQNASDCSHWPDSGILLSDDEQPEPSNARASLGKGNSHQNPRQLRQESAILFGEEDDLFRLLAIEQAKEGVFQEELELEMLPDEIVKYVEHRPSA
jgi:hypothetical protein